MRDPSTSERERVYDVLLLKIDFLDLLIIVELLLDFQNSNSMLNVFHVDAIRETFGDDVITSTPGQIDSTT